MAPDQGAPEQEFPQVSVLVLDSGAVTSLARRDPRRAASVHHSGDGSPQSTVVPAVVLVECLSGRQRTDAEVNRFLKKCMILDAPDEKLARRAGALRAQAGRGSAVDAVVVALAEPGGAVLTHDMEDLRALAAHARDVSVFAA